MWLFFLFRRNFKKLCHSKKHLNIGEKQKQKGEAKEVKLLIIMFLYLPLSRLIDVSSRSRFFWKIVTEMDYF